MPRQVKCPRCGTVNTVADGARPVCSNCGFGGPGAMGAAPAAPPAGYPPQGQYGQSPYGQQPYGYGMPPAAQPKGMAVASMVVGIASCCIWIIPFVGIFLSLGAGITASILAIQAMKRIKAGQQGGKGMAITGLVLGIITLAVTVLLLILMLFAQGILIELCKDQPDNPACEDYRTTAVRLGDLPERLSAWAASVSLPRPRLAFPG